ncbi:MAG: hypothetical protein NZ895_06630 [Archaeoglobaceae archaeon]|nr:hypothetical protein [Archaeoglobaceae archaeon]MCX8152269.1 hypothetical protein [Archaeoglobaceae archaeon]MDW8013947.1 hypothetical protein [Archaeoglobaceae archaeon]
MRLDGIVVVLLMLLPFAFPKIPNILTFIYWNVISLAYLFYIAIKRWEFV